jgi:hypothetical protein
MRRLLLLPLAFLLLLAAACGGDESGELSREEYTKRANAICTEVEKTLDGLGDFANFQELSKEMTTARDALQDSIDELRALQPPVELRGQHKKYVDLQVETRDIAERISEAAGKEPADQVEMQKQAERADKITVEQNETARKLKLDACIAGGAA